MIYNGMNPHVSKLADIETTESFKLFISESEAPFAANSYDGESQEFSEQRLPAYEYTPGTIPVLVSAPHATNHFREGRTKIADTLTGSIAKAIGALTGAHVICRTYNDMHDPNFYDEMSDGGYKNAVCKIVDDNGIVIMLDIHGAAAHRNFDVDLGTVNGNTIFHDDSIIRLVRESLKTHGIFRVGHNMVFDASRKETMTNYIHRKLGIACIQVEINRLLRDPDDMDSLKRLVMGFTDFIRMIEL